MSTNYTWKSASELAELVRRGEVSPVELVEDGLRRIDQLNPQLNAFLAVDAEGALRTARTAEKSVVSGDTLGPLHGVPVPIKDVEEAEGLPHTAGSLVYKDRIATFDSLATRRIRAAGGIIMGKTNTSEFGQIGTNENRLGDACRNPWNPEMTSGASSGGSAVAVSTGISSIAQGGDGGGSIRIPASMCGIYGIKPTQGRIPRLMAGETSYHSVKFAQSGPLARTVKDAALLLGVLAGPAEDGDKDAIQSAPPDFMAALDESISGLRVAWSPDLGGVAVDPEVRQLTESAARAFEGLGCNIDVPEFRPGSPEEVFRTFDVIYNSRVFATNGHLLENNRDQLTDYFIEGLENGKSFTAADLFHAMSKLEVYRAYVREFFSKYDILLTPTLATPSFPVGQHPETIDGKAVPHRHWGFTPFTYLFNMTGNPAASIPAGFTSSGLPVGLHIVGRFGEETTVLAASARFEEARPWAGRIPTIANF
ncbi:MAG: amidase [Chloroflexi bacterium]|nr:amidase [Chloroflexota bacterium]